MDINIHNYEQFFLLYVDDELCAAERQAVEIFIEKHPALREELQALQAAVLASPGLESFDKSCLFRTEAIDVNLQEAMLLAMDDELPATEARVLQSMLVDNVHLQKEWEHLQKTKLDSTEVVSFPAKASLYRKEKSRVISMAFVRWSVAAAVLFAGLFIAQKLMQDKPENAPEVASENTKPLSKPGDSIEKGVNTAPAKSEATLAQAQEPEDVPETARPANQKAPQYKLTGNTKDVAAQNVRPDKIVQQQQSEKVSLVNELPVAEKQQQQLLVKTQEPVLPKKIMDVDVTPDRPSYAQYTMLEEPEHNDDKILLMNEEDVARSKAGAFFKMLKRTVARSANIKTGNSLKIAGFEFAVK